MWCNGTGIIEICASCDAENPDECINANDCGKEDFVETACGECGGEGYV